MGDQRRGNAIPDVETMAKQQRCLDLKVRGFTYAEIAEEEGYSGESGARAAVHAVLKRVGTDAAEEVRPVMLARAEQLWFHGFAVMLEGRDQGDMDRFVKGAGVADKALARLLKLHNLDTAEVNVHIGGGGELDKIKAEFAALMEGTVVDAEVVPEGQEDEQDT